MDNKQLVDLKGQIINELTPLIEKAAIEPEQKFEILMLASRNNGELASLQAAHEAALKIEDDGTKADALMALLEEIDFRLRPDEEKPIDEQSPSASMSETNN